VIAELHGVTLRERRPGAAALSLRRALQGRHPPDVPTGRAIPPRPRLPDAINQFPVLVEINRAILRDLDYLAEK
jgi:hypothetical protein